MGALCHAARRLDRPDRITQQHALCVWLYIYIMLHYDSTFKFASRACGLMLLCYHGACYTASSSSNCFLLVCFPTCRCRSENFQNTDKTFTFFVFFVGLLLYSVVGSRISQQLIWNNIHMIAAVFHRRVHISHTNTTDSPYVKYH